MFRGELRPFQQEAFEAMVDRGVALLAYDMGLGKTPITIAAIERLVEMGEVSSGIVVVPNSLKYQWEHQILKFAEDASVLVIDGTPAQRREQYRLAREGVFDYIILNYDQVIRDWSDVRSLPRDYMVCDEITAIKGFRAQRSKKIKKLNATYKFGLTGQPVENRAEELFSIMEWVDPSILGRWDIFDRTYIKRDKTTGRVRFYRRLPMLRRRLAPVLLRKTREEVKDELPAVVEEMIIVNLDGPGKRLYNTISKELLKDLYAAMNTFGSGFSLWRNYHGVADPQQAMRGQIMSKLTALRMLCDSPRLVRWSAERYLDPHVKGGSEYAASLLQRGLLDKLKGEPKLGALTDSIIEVVEASRSNKVVVFSFFKHMLRLIAEHAEVPYVMFTGSMSAKDRSEAQRSFRTDKSVRLFLSSDAGAYGVDLPEGNHLYSYDLPWTTGKLDQRNARIIRLSSEFDSVNLLYMLIHGSVEERQFEMLEQKGRLASAILDGKGIDRQGKLTLDLKTLTHFLETSAV